MINEAPTFDHFTMHALFWLCSADKGGPDSVGDGRHLSNEALAVIGAELWSAEDLLNKDIILNFACLEHNFASLRINHEPFPKDAERRLERMIKDGAHRLAVPGRWATT